MDKQIKDITNATTTELCNELKKKVESRKTEITELQQLNKIIVETLAISELRHHERKVKCERNLCLAAIGVFAVLVFMLFTVVCTSSHNVVALVLRGVGILCLTALLFGLARAYDRLVDRD